MRRLLALPFFALVLTGCESEEYRAAHPNPKWEITYNEPAGPKTIQTDNEPVCLDAGITYFYVNGLETKVPTMNVITMRQRDASDETPRCPEDQTADPEPVRPKK
jgi:hypothetical protein